MSKQIIAVDIDDVLAVENDTVRQFMNSHYGLSHGPEDYLIEGTFWGYWTQAMGVDKEEGAHRYEAYAKSGTKGLLPVMPGAVETIQELKRRYQLVIITSRDDTIVELTKDWLARHFPDTFDRVEFVALWSGDHKSNKVSICTQIGAAYLIDDNADYCIAAEEAGVQSVLFGDYGWNRHVKVPASVVRCKDWLAVREYFND